MSYIKARPTIYKGIQMRSRLEAKFAKWLDDHSASNRGWQYEPDCYADETGEYLPDFEEFGPASAPKQFYEVKPEVADFDAALKRMHVIRSTHPDATLTVVTYDDSAESVGFYSAASCKKLQPCHHCKPAPSEVQWDQVWDQEEARIMFDMILELKKQRSQLDAHLTKLNEWVDGLVSESRCAIGTPEWLTEAIDNRPRTIRVDSQ